MTKSDIVIKGIKIDKISKIFGWYIEIHIDSYKLGKGEIK